MVLHKSLPLTTLPHAELSVCTKPNKHVLPKQDKPGCFKFCSGWFLPKCKREMGLRHSERPLCMVMPPKYLVDFNLHCLPMWCVSFLPLQRKKESLLFHTLSIFKFHFKTDAIFNHYFPFISTAPLHGSPSTRAKLTVPHSSKPCWWPSSHSYAHSEHYKSAQISSLPWGNVFFLQKIYIASCRNFSF